MSTILQQNNQRVSEINHGGVFLGTIKENNKTGEFVSFDSNGVSLGKHPQNLAFKALVTL